MYIYFFKKYIYTKYPSLELIIVIVEISGLQSGVTETESHGMGKNILDYPFVHFIQTKSKLY